MTIKAKVKKRAPAKHDWRKMLEAIVTFVNVHDEHSKNLWNVLSALRGPDEDNLGHVKFDTTGVIRHTVGIIPGPTWMVAVPDAQRYANARKTLEDSHFVIHARRAFIALGLKWDEVNK